MCAAEDPRAGAVQRTGTGADEPRRVARRTVVPGCVADVDVACFQGGEPSSGTGEAKVTWLPSALPPRVSWVFGGNESPWSDAGDEHPVAVGFELVVDPAQ